MTDTLEATDIEGDASARAGTHAEATRWRRISGCS